MLTVWLPYLYLDYKIHPEKQIILLFLRIILSLGGVFISISYFLPYFKKYVLSLGNFVVFLVLQLSPLISLVTENNHAYITGYAIGVMAVGIYPLPFLHILIQVLLSLAQYIILGMIMGINILFPGGEFSYSGVFLAYNLLLAYSICLIMSFVSEKIRLRSMAHKIKLDETRKSLKQRKARMEKDLQIGRRVQSRLLPASFPSNELLDAAGLYKSMEDVGGDFYEIQHLLNITDEYQDKDVYVIFIADASGHGVSAALISTMAQLLFRQALSEKIRAANEILLYINTKIQPYLLDEHYLTAFVMLIDFQQKKYFYSNAAHRPVFILDTTGKYTALDTGGTIIGTFSEAKFASGSAPLEEGQLILFYTDGIVECCNEQDEEYGELRLKETLKEMRGEDLIDILNCLYENALTFAENNTPEDDITLLLLKVKSLPGASL